jgi:hypothetical protein
MPESLAQFYFNNRNAVVVDKITECREYLQKYFTEKEGYIWIYHSDLHAFCDCDIFKGLYLSLVENMQNIIEIRLVIEKTWLDAPKEYWDQIKSHLKYIPRTRQKIKYIFLDDAKRKYGSEPIRLFTSDECFIFYTGLGENPLSDDIVCVQRIFVPHKHDASKENHNAENGPQSLSVRDLRITIVASTKAYKDKPDPIPIYLKDEIRSYFENVFSDSTLGWQNKFIDLVSSKVETMEHDKSCTAYNLRREDIGDGDNNFWYRPTDSNTVIVFVHGLFGDSKNAWYNEKMDVFWPDLVDNDGEFNSPGIYLGGFPAREFHDLRNSAIQKYVDNLWLNLNNKDIYGRPALTTKDNILFLCHSLGGVVVRSLLNKKREHFKNKSVGLALIASPTLGTKHANWLIKLEKVIKCKVRVIKELAYENWGLENLNTDFRNLISENLIPQLSICEAYESNDTKIKKLFGYKVRVVDKESASVYKNVEAEEIYGTDHISIVKPDDVEHKSHQFLSRFWKKFPKKEIMVEKSK